MADCLTLDVVPRQAESLPHGGVHRPCYWDTPAVARVLGPARGQ